MYRRCLPCNSWTSVAASVLIETIMKLYAAPSGKQATPEKQTTGIHVSCTPTYLVPTPTHRYYNWPFQFISPQLAGDFYTPGMGGEGNSPKAKLIQSLRRIYMYALRGWIGRPYNVTRRSVTTVPSQTIQIGLRARLEPAPALPLATPFY